MGENGIAFEKGCLLTIFQVVIIVLAYTVIGVNEVFEQAVKPELKCLNISDTRKLCLSVFQRNSSRIPYNKGVKAISLRLNKFKVLQFEQDPIKLKDLYKNSVDEYFHFINYDKSLQSIQSLSLDTTVSAIQQIITDQEGTFHQKPVKTIQIHPDSQVVVFYFVLLNNGPVITQPQVKIIFPNRNSIQFNNKFSIIECFLGVFLLISWIIYRFLIDKSPTNIKFWELKQLSRVNRIIQFVINFAMNNVVYFLTINKFWSTFGLNFINEILGFQTRMVPFFEANSYASFINLFPQWLLLSYFVYLVLERYVSWSSLKMMIISGLTGALLFVIPYPWPQFIFQLSIIFIGLILSISIKSNSNNKLTVSLVFSAVTLILMILVKIKWVLDNSENNDFMLRFFFNQLFVMNSFLSFFIGEQQISAQQKRKYIPYEEYSMEQQHEMEENDMIPPHAQKIGSQEKV